MCGIWFYTQLSDQNNKEAIKNARDEITKRGPDRSIHEAFTFGKFEFFLSFHRLAIMDLSNAGDQPFVISDMNNGEKIYLMCNGEIYGFGNLVKEFLLQNL
jgi:asparagine synthase (glutamine-hydrolysing)